jgi:2-C-methyl-D-erythritol 4-phosphate cytidylyltransferase
MVFAVIAAGGQGDRMGRSRPKQFLTLAGEPILLRTLRVFERCKAVDRICLVVPSTRLEWCRKRLVDALNGSTPINLITAGPSRQQSVYNGLQSLPAGDHMVLIHDGVRPFVSNEQILILLETARRTGACIPGLPIDDSIKHVDDAGRVVDSPTREALWIAQTPQAFRCDLIRSAHESARRQGYRATDDAALVERSGHPVKVVEGSRFNIKITRPEDMILAAAILQCHRL